MPKKRPPLVNEEIYHIVTRGVGDTEIFQDKNDYYRAIFSLYEFNDRNSVLIRSRRRARLYAKKGGLETFSADRKLMVEILSFCFMPNHIHLLLRQIIDNGITQFMRKFGTGYASYFNKKYNRRGHLFQARFHAVHVATDKQLKIVFSYIHTNPISLIEPSWKEIGISNPSRVRNFLEQYKWSSYPDYIGKKNFPSVTERNFMLAVMGEKQGCKNFVNSWIKHKQKVTEFDNLLIE